MGLSLRSLNIPSTLAMLPILILCACSPQKAVPASRSAPPAEGPDVQPAKKDKSADVSVPVLSSPEPPVIQGPKPLFIEASPDLANWLSTLPAQKVRVRPPKLKRKVRQGLKAVERRFGESGRYRFEWVITLFEAAGELSQHLFVLRRGSRRAVTFAIRKAERVEFYPLRKVGMVKFGFPYKIRFDGDKRDDLFLETSEIVPGGSPGKMLSGETRHGFTILTTNPPILSTIYVGSSYRDPRGATLSTKDNRLEQIIGTWPLIVDQYPVFVTSSRLIEGGKVTGHGFGAWILRDAQGLSPTPLYATVTKEAADRSVLEALFDPPAPSEVPDLEPKDETKKPAIDELIVPGSCVTEVGQDGPQPGYFLVRDLHLKPPAPKTGQRLVKLTPNSPNPRL